MTPSMDQGRAPFSMRRFLTAMVLFVGTFGMANLRADDGASAARKLNEPFPVEVGHTMPPDFFQAADCWIVRVEATDDRLRCEFDGPWTSAPNADFKTFSQCGFSMFRNGAGKAEWEWICNQFKRMEGKRTTITLSAGAWSSRSGFLMFAYQSGRVDAGTTQAMPPDSRIPFHEAPAPSRITARFRYSNTNTLVE